MNLSKKLLVVALLLPAALSLVTLSPQGNAQDKPAAKKEAKAPKGRLPPYYTDVVTEEQRKTIYTIQAKHQKAIDGLKEQLAAATKAQDEEIEAVLSTEQKAKVEAAKAAATAKKKKPAEGEKKPEAKS